MAYELHVERDHSSIDLEEWVNAVGSIEGARISSEGSSAKNPQTGEVIEVSGGPGDVEILFKTSGFLGFGKREDWEQCIRFSNGRGSFNATEDIQSETNPVRNVAIKLANKLSAKIVGDEGETYNW